MHTTPNASQYKKLRNRVTAARLCTLNVFRIQLGGLPGTCGTVTPCTLLDLHFQFCCSSCSCKLCFAVMVRFVVQEQMGVPEDVAWLRGGIVEFDPAEGFASLAATLRYFLAAPGLRHRIASLDFERLVAWNQSSLLRLGIESLFD